MPRPHMGIGENAVTIQRSVPSFGCRHTLGFERLDKPRTRNTQLRLIQAKDIHVIASSRHTWSRGQLVDRGYVGQRSIEQCCVPLPASDMFLKTRELREQDRRLKFRHAEITAQIVVIVPRRPLRSTAVREAATKVREVFVICHEDSAFSCGDILGNLKTERAASAN